MNEAPQISLMSAGEFTWFAGQCRAPRLRSMREFAEQEIILPNGPKVGRRYRCDNQPYSRLWFDEIDRGHWKINVATGPSQSGKTLTCSVIPVLYHLFEIGETVIFGLPDMAMAADKWNQDFRPVIDRMDQRYRALLPTRGAGSRGGKITSITFKNGATLRFMSGGGGDKSRAAFTARALVITETDGMDEAGGASDEADKIAQLIARTRSFDDRARIYMECTLTTKSGRTWREYENGTASRIVLHCPHCGAWVTPERDHLVGWKEAPTVLDAKENACFCCPACAAPWSEDDRTKANREAKLLHRGQELDAAGRIHGERPRTDTLGFRWSAVNNLFVSAGSVGADEWKAVRAEDEENAEKELRQFIWAIPYEPPIDDLLPLGYKEIIERQGVWRRGELPEWTEHLTLGCDLGKHAAHWSLWAWGTHPEGGIVAHVVDYGVAEIPGGEMAPDRAILLGLRTFRDERIRKGWGAHGRQPDVCIFDSRFEAQSVRDFCRESGRSYLPSMGYGATQRQASTYTHPKSKNAGILFVGLEFYVTLSSAYKSRIVHVNADHWKSFVHARLSSPVGTPGALTLFRVERALDHLSYAKHLTSEKKVEQFLPGRGVVIRWEQLNPNNHWLDSCQLACVGGYLAGVRVNKVRRAVAAAAPARLTPAPLAVQPEGEPIRSAPLVRNPGHHGAGQGSGHYGFRRH